MITLGDICTKASSNIAQKDLNGCTGIYPIYGAGGLIKYVDFYQQKEPYVAVVKDGAGVGRVMRLPEKSSVIGTMQYIIPNQNINVSYLAYALEHMNLAKYYTGATIPHIYFKDYCRETLPVHNSDEQYKIATVLDKLSHLIFLRKQQLDKLDELVKLEFIEMFGDPIKNERNWRVLPLRCVLEFGRTVTYGIVKTGKELQDGVPVFRPIDITNGHKPKRNELKCTTQEISNQYKRTLLNGTELLITVRGSVGETFQVTKEFDGCNVGRNIVPFRFNHSLVGNCFMEILFHQESTKNYLSSITKGIALQGVNMSEFKEMPVIIPPVGLQHKIEAICDQNDKSKLTIQQSLDKLEALKKSLMQQYFE